MKLKKSFFILALSSQALLMAESNIPDWNKYIPGNDKNQSVFYGPTQIHDKKMEELTVFGPASIKNSTIKKVKVEGPLEAIRSSFEDLTMDGIAKFDDVKITKLYINGPINASNSTFDNISIATNELILTNTKVNTLVVRKNKFISKSQIVYLEKGTHVKSLTFEGQNGSVIVSDSSVVVDELIGGEIKK